MKNNMIITSLAIILISLFLLPNNVYAEIESTNLREAVDEEIELFKNESSYKEAIKELESYDLTDYKDSKNKVNVYIFRGSTCSHCFEAIAHFASIYKEAGKYFNVKTYEVWGNEDNSILMEDVAEKLGDEVGGVPYIVIGDKSWSGYASSYDNEMMDTIKKEYKKSNDKRKDIVKSISSQENKESSDIIPIIITILVAGLIVFGVIMARKNTNE